ncbi:MAG: cation diffusion facilitator family transporter [Elusimicrobiota bacterium]|nr:cation diffusion facilitator family transporter [Elusimicrobiota bacterium]MDH5662063.1 cation diffusion facilitator family transporter [Elusimicrobiota bacterium]
MAQQQCETCGRKATWLSAGQNVVLAFLKGLVGYATGSRALLADALHSGADVACALLAAWGTRFGEKPVDKTHPYGYGKVEFVVGIVVGIVLIFAAGEILYGSSKVLFSQLKITPPRLLAVWVALLSVYSNFVISHYTMCAAKELNSPALKSISIDNRSDAYSSIPVVICILGSQLGFPQLDPLAAVFVGLLVFKMGAGLVIENYRGLLDVSVKPEQVEEIRKAIISLPGVKKISYLRTRQIGKKIWVDVEVYVREEKTFKEANVVSREIRSTLMRKMHYIGNVQVSLRPMSATSS